MGVIAITKTITATCVMNVQSIVAICADVKIDSDTECENLTH